MSNIFEQKYLKYKRKYLSLKGGSMASVPMEDTVSAAAHVVEHPTTKSFDNSKMPINIEFYDNKDKSVDIPSIPMEDTEFVSARALVVEQPTAKSEDKLSIKIDDITFIVLNKSLINEYIFEKQEHTCDTKRLYINYKSIDNNGIENTYVAYTSISELFCWRLCYGSRGDRNIYKFNNYVQSTILDFRLQKYIWEIFLKIPLKGYIDGEYTSVKEINKEVAFARPVQVSSAPIIGAICCPYLQNTPQDRVISDYIIQRLKTIEGIELYDKIYMSNFLEKYYNLEGCELIFENTLNYQALKIIIKIYNCKLQLKNKDDDISRLLPPILYLHIGYTLIEYIYWKTQKPTTNFGYYILNIIDDNVKIDKYGMYNKYYTGSGYANESLDTYITKPLDYESMTHTYGITEYQGGLAKISSLLKMQYIEHDEYYFCAFENNHIFPIKNIIKLTKEKCLDNITIQTDLIGNERLSEYISTFKKLYDRYKTFLETHIYKSVNKQTDIYEKLEEQNEILKTIKNLLTSIESINPEIKTYIINNIEIIQTQEMYVDKDELKKFIAAGHWYARHW